MIGSGALVLFSRRAGFDNLSCLGTRPLYPRRNRRLHLWPAPRGRDDRAQRAFREGLAALSPAWRDRLGPDRVIDLSVLGEVSTSALTADMTMDKRPDGLPATFVPGRNLVFMTFAAIAAYQRDLKFLVTGVCETDFSGYPDCRDDTMKALQAAINLGMAARLVIETPLMWIDKAETWRLAETLGGPPLVNLIIERTHTCYFGDRKTRNDWGYGCGRLRRLPPARRRIPEIQRRAEAHSAAALSAPSPSPVPP